MSKVVSVTQLVCQIARFANRQFRLNDRVSRAIPGPDVPPFQLLSLNGLPVIEANSHTSNSHCLDFGVRFSSACGAR